MTGTYLPPEEYKIAELLSAFNENQHSINVHEI